MVSTGFPILQIKKPRLSHLCKVIPLGTCAARVLTEVSGSRCDGRRGGPSFLIYTAADSSSCLSLSVSPLPNQALPEKPGERRKEDN